MRLTHSLIALLSIIISISAKAVDYEAGVASVDVTPDFPVRLSGYGSRTEETTEIQQHLFVKALALRADHSKPALLITVDNCAGDLDIAEEVCAWIKRRRGVPRERIAINYSHTHSAPMLTGVIPNIFSKEIPPEHQEHIDQYTQLMVDSMEKAAQDALDNMAPAKLYFGIGEAAFGTNRRTLGGPTDHDLPVLCVKDADDKVRALVAGYACHCTTLSANIINGDWSGYAQESMQTAFPGAIGLVAVGCGGDQNPMPRGKVEQAQQYGQAIADGVKKVVDNDLREIDAPLACVLKQVPLAFDPLPTREEWEQRAKEDSPRGYHARVQLAKLDNGEELDTEIPYTVQTWAFGDQLAMLFLAGEVVVDYSTRFKIEYDRSRLWVCGYSNDVPCYIPSARIREEGGYEGGEAMIYYDRPTRFAADVEDRIVAAVHEVMPEAYKNNNEKTNGFPPLRPYDALHEFVLPDGYEAQLIACEPQVKSPVAVEFAPDGAIFVAEMYDYNIPPKENTPPSGRIRRLVDTNGDGFYDQATIYLDNVPYPTGVTVWRGGILVCAAPDIIYAEDTDGDGVAEVRKVLFTGFSTGNYQARVNSLSWGLDNWMYGGGGLTGGRITRPDGSGETVSLGGRDFRFNPDTMEFETATGQSQYGRARDDADNWFGCDSSNLLKYYALPEHILAKSTNVAPPETTVVLAGPPYDVYPASTYVERMNDPDDLNRITSACGLGIYRDDILGAAFQGNAFNCEPVHNLMTRLIIEPKGASFTAHRAPGEEKSEFFASKDHWFRPAQVRTGPDGALWVVDMYRYVIEHEKWITPDRRESLDMFAGKDRGRIYRIKPKDAKLRPIQDLSKLSTPDLVDVINTPNGTVRDLVQEMLIWRKDDAAADPLKAIVTDDAAPEYARVQALCTLDGLGSLDDDTLATASTTDLGTPISDSPLLRHAARLMGPRLQGSPDLQERAGELAVFPLPFLAEHAAFALAQWKSPSVSRILADMLVQWSRGSTKENAQSQSTFDIRPAPDAYVMAAVLLASEPRIADVTEEFLKHAPAGVEPAFKGLAQLAGAKGSTKSLQMLLASAAKRADPALVLDVLDAALAHGHKVTELAHGWGDKSLRLLLDQARAKASDESAADDDRAIALRLLATAGDVDEETLAAFKGALQAQVSAELQMTAIKALASREDEEVGAFLLSELPELGPAERDAALDALIRRVKWCGPLLDYLEKSPEAHKYIDAARRQFLTRHPDIDVRERAVRVLGETAPGQREELVAKYKEAGEIVGDAGRGAKLFEERCAQCHQLGKVGHALGPDLSALTDKSPAVLLKAILDPNETVLEQYQAFTVETKDLRTLSGIIAEESANSIKLKMAGGSEEILLRSDIDRLTNTTKSLMPEGLEENLQPAQMADLIAFIQSNAPAPKSFKGNAPSTVTVAPDGNYALTAENGAIYGGPDIEYRPRFGAIGGWALPVDRAEWDLDAAEAGDFHVLMTWTSPPTSEGSPWRIECGGVSLEGELASTGSWEDFIMRDMGMLHLEAGKQTLVLHTTAPVKDGMMELRAITLKRSGK